MKNSKTKWLYHYLYGFLPYKNNNDLTKYKNLKSWKKQQNIQLNRQKTVNQATFSTSTVIN
tara:strand:- start:612 stop:794 length:183 start_codon:yes stop_codon:yes gene_type:complete